MMNPITYFIDYLGRAFVDPYVLSFTAIQEGGEQAKAGILLLLVTLGGHLLILLLFKIVVWNSIFPKLRTVDEYKNRTTHCRIYLKSRHSSDVFRQSKYANMFSEDIPSDYYWAKFRWFPVLDVHRIRIERVWKRRRWPWHLDIYTNASNLVWNAKLQSWQFDLLALKAHEEQIAYYKEVAMTDVKEIADNVLTGVKGDYDLIKDKFKLGLSVQKVKQAEKEEDDEDDDT